MEKDLNLFGLWVGDILKKYIAFKTSNVYKPWDQEGGLGKAILWWMNYIRNEVVHEAVAKYVDSGLDGMDDEWEWHGRLSLVGIAERLSQQVTLNCVAHKLI